jgi:hypothetical protein
MRAFHLRAVDATVAGLCTPAPGRIIGARMDARERSWTDHGLIMDAIAFGT